VLAAVQGAQTEWNVFVVASNPLVVLDAPVVVVAWDVLASAVFVAFSQMVVVRVVPALWKVDAALPLVGSFPDEGALFVSDAAELVRCLADRAKKQVHFCGLAQHVEVREPVFFQELAGVLELRFFVVVFLFPTQVLRSASRS
jgi:hypothetical protein